MTRKAAIVIGHSHLSSFLRYLPSRPSDPTVGDSAIEYYIFDTTRAGAGFNFSVPDTTGNFVLNPAIDEMVKRTVPSDRESVYISMFGGNAHNALTLLEHPRPFDIIIPENPILPLIPNTEIIPFGYIDDFLRKLTESYILNMVCMRNVTTGSVLHIESPPPVGSDQFVLDHLEGYFLDQSKHPHIAPALLRYKMWRAHSRIIKSACDSCNIEFLPVPEEAMTSEGYLKPEGYSDDSTHANGWYGACVMRQIEARFGFGYGGWNWLY